MNELRNQQTVSLTDDTAFGVNLEVPYIDEGPSSEIRNSSGELAAEHTEAGKSVTSDPEYLIQTSENNDSAFKSNESSPAFLVRILAIFSCCSGDNKSVTVSPEAETLTNEFTEFMSGVRRYYKNIFGFDLLTDTDEWYRELFAPWNTFLQWKQGIRDTSAIISSDIKEDINAFILWQEELEGVQLTEDTKKWFKGWLPQWNMFLLARAGETLATCSNLFLTIVGFIFYTVDQVSDIGTSMYYVSNGQWWQAMVTLAIVYGAVTIYAVWKWIDGQINCTGTVDWLRYVGSLLVNWPNVKQYGALCLLEWKLHELPANTAHLIPEWHERRVSVALLKFTEGVCEACPQAILQLCLLVPNLNGVLTWTDYLRIASASVSLCTAGAALVNKEKCHRINDNIDMPPCELVVLYVWAVPVTVSRLMSATLLLSVHPYWTLAAVALLLGLRAVYWCRTKGVPRELDDVMYMCLNTIYFLISPFGVAGSITSRRVYHAIHFLVNTVATVVWALGTPLVCAHPALYSAIICLNAVMFTVGLLGWQLHEKYWRR